jgi:hypothetical protein
MVTYIYFVKCPGCEDEHFDFFDDAKAFAMGCLSQKPVITQVEVDRNDFGECTDSIDHGVQWSWEDECEPEAEPITFSKDDINTAYDPDNDPEFQDDDFFAINAEDSNEPITEEFDRVKAAAQCMRNCYDFYEAIASKKPQTEINKHGKKAYKFVKDRFGLVDDKAEDLLWSGYVLWKRLHESNKTESLTEAKTDPFHEAIFEAIDYLTEFNDIFPVPENIGADTWKELKDDISYGLSSDFEIAEIIMEYLDKDLAIGRKHPEMFEDDPQSELTLETYNRLKRAYDRAVAAYEAEHPEDFEESCRKPIPEGMTIEQLVEEMEENEDTVECTLCNDLFDKSECRKELNLGWLCRRCADDLAARGEGPVFKEDNYWDFLDESDKQTSTWTCYWDGAEIGTVEATDEDDANYQMQQKYPEYPYGKYKHDDMYWVEPAALEEAKEIHDLGNEYDGGYPTTQTWVCYFDGVDIGTVEAATEDEALEKMQQEYPEYPYGLRREVDIWVEPAESDSLTESTLTEAAGYDCPKLREADNNKPGIAKFKILFQFRRNPAVQGTYGDCPYLSGVTATSTFKNVFLRDINRQSYGEVKDIELADNGEVMLITTTGKKYSLRYALRIASPATDKFSNTRKVLLAIKDAAEAAEKTLDTKTVRNLRVRNALAQLDETVANEFKAAITNIVFRIPSHNAYSAEDILDIDPDASEAIAEKAAEKINKIHDDFYGLPFVSANKDQMESSGMIEERVPAEKAAWINSSWGAVGKIYFDRPINQLSADAQKVIANAKLSDAKVDPTANSVDCYRLATELIRFFGNDPWFFKKSGESEAVDEAFDLDFPEI